MIFISEISLEYLQAFHRLVKGHPHIYSQVIEEIHKRARGSAGGQVRARKASEAQEEEISLEDMLAHPGEESPVKATNAAFSEGDFVETEDYFDVPTVFAKEGVFTGTNGIPQLKTFDALAASAPRFLGVPITPAHIETDTLRPDDRWLGHIISAAPREDKRDIFGISRYFKDNLTEDEITKIRSKQYPDGSIGYFTPLKNEAGEFNGEKYAAEETGNYIVTEYATFFDGTKGACTREQGCGPFQNAKKKDDFPKSDDKLVLDKNGNVKKCPKKQKNGEDSMSEEMEKKLNSAYTEIESLKAEIEKLKNAKPPEVDFSPVQSEIDSLKEKFANAAKEQDAARDAANKEAFAEKYLNAAAKTEKDAIWEQVKNLNPVEFVAWTQANPNKLLNEAEKKATKGKKQTNAAGGWDLAAEQAKVWGY